MTISKKCQECIDSVHKIIDERFAETREYLYTMINKEIEAARIHAKSSSETRERFERNEKAIQAMDAKFGKFLSMFTEHLATREKQMSTISETIDAIASKLESHVFEEGKVLVDMHESIKKISPFIEEANRAKIAEDYLAEKESRNAKKWKTKMGWVERILWITGAVAALGSLYLMAREIFS